MNTTPSSESQHSEQSQAAGLLARFDTARDAFLAAFAEAPDDALPYTPAGEEYALGVLPPHLQDSASRLRLLQRPPPAGARAPSSAQPFRPAL